MPRPAPLTRAARPRRGSPDATRDRLVQAAAEVFNQDGYFHTDSNKLARAAGYSPGTFYQHFADKRALFLAAYQRWVKDERADLAATLAGLDGAAARARAWARVVVAHHRRWAVLRQSLRALVLSDAVVRDFVLAERAAQLEALAALRRQLRLGKRSRADDWALLIYLERVADSIAWGEAAALGVSERGLQSALERALIDYFRSTC